MRFLLAFLLMLPVLAWGQSSLPPCTATEKSFFAYRHNCFGTLTWPSGAKYVGEWRHDKFHGQGWNLNLLTGWFERDVAQSKDSLDGQNPKPIIQPPCPPGPPPPPNG